MLANAGNAMLEVRLFQHHPDACSAMLPAASYCEAGFKQTVFYQHCACLPIDMESFRLIVLATVKW